MKKIQKILAVVVLASLTQSVKTSSLIKANMDAAANQIEAQVGDSKSFSMLKEAVNKYTAFTGTLSRALFAATTAHNMVGVGINPKDSSYQTLAGLLSMAHLAGVTTKLALDSSNYNSKLSFIGSFTSASKKLMEALGSQVPMLSTALSAIGSTARTEKFFNKLVFPAVKPALTSGGPTIEPLD